MKTLNVMVLLLTLGLAACGTRAPQSERLPAATKEAEARSICNSEFVDTGALDVPVTGKRILLTVHTMPGSEGRQRVLDTLQRHQIPATYFIFGENVAAEPDLLAKLKANPKITIGALPFKRQNRQAPSREEEIAQINQSIAVLKLDPQPKYFRFRSGRSYCASARHVQELGYKIVGWHVDSCDWAFDKKNEITDNVAANTCKVHASYRKNWRQHVIHRLEQTRGGILVIEDHRRNTAGQLDALIRELMDRGYSFGSITDPEFEAFLLSDS